MMTAEMTLTGIFVLFAVLGLAALSPTLYVLGRKLSGK